MIWQNPWAWLGLLLVAVPIIVHLLARRSARVQSFPTLRFLQPTPPLATRRTRITDPLLLAVRIAIVVAAVAALAQPFFLTAERSAASARNVARAVVVDTSASVAGASAVVDSVVAADAAFSSTSVVIRTATPGEALAGAAAWLATRRVRGEVVVYSDFQLGAVDSLDLARIPAHVGVRLRRTVAPPRDSIIEYATRTTRVRGSPSAGAYEWTRSDGESAQHDLVVLGTEAQRAGVAAAMGAADLRGALTIARPVALLFDGQDVAARPLTEPWMADVVLSLRDDALLRAVADTIAALADAAPWLAITRDGAVSAASASINRIERLVLLVHGEAASSTTAALIAALGTATAAGVPVNELEPRTLTDAQLNRWQREPVDAPAGANVDGSDGRWLWLLVLVLLLAETVLRRQRPVMAS